MLTIPTNSGSFVKDEIISFPIAHSQGNYYVNKDDLKKIEDNEQIIFKYFSDGSLDKKFNPNGSIKNIAGITTNTKVFLA